MIICLIVKSEVLKLHGTIHIPNLKGNNLLSFCCMLHEQWGFIIHQMPAHFSGFSRRVLFTLHVFQKEYKTELAFNWDMCTRLALCLCMMLLHFANCFCLPKMCWVMVTTLPKMIKKHKTTIVIWILFSS